MQRRKFITSTLAVSVLGPSVASVKKGTPKYGRSTKSILVRAGEDRFHEPIKFRGISPNLVKISAKDTDGQLSIFEYEGLAKMGPDLHVHFNQDEIFYIIDGEYLFQVGDEQQTLKAGDTIFLPRNVPHTWLQLTEKGKMIYLLQPAGKMEEFFKELNALKRPPTAQEMQAFALESGQKIVGPPLSVK